MSKTGKVINFTSRAELHDVNNKLKSILKWLKSGHDVRVRIDGSAGKIKSMEGIVKQIEEDTNAKATISQKVVKPDVIKFILKPSQEAVDIDLDKSEKKQVDDDLDKLLQNKDLLSDDFEKELQESLRRNKSKKI